MTHQIPLAEVFGAPVRTAGTRVGVVDGVYVDRAVERLVGLEVAGPNNRRWYLPWAAATVEEGAIAAASPLVFVPFDQVGFYVEHGTRLPPREAEALAVDASGLLSRRAPDVERAAERMHAS
jgi:hypothetical protein